MAQMLAAGMAAKMMGGGDKPIPGGGDSWQHSQVQGTNLPSTASTTAMDMLSMSQGQKQQMPSSTGPDFGYELMKASPQFSAMAQMAGGQDFRQRFNTYNQQQASTNKYF